MSAVSSGGAGMKRIGVTLAGLVLATTVAAQEKPVLGAGVMASRCSALVASMDETVSVARHPLAGAMLSWAEGYITATNVELGGRGEAQFDLGSLSRLELWAAIYGHCKRNPDHLGVQAAISAMVMLKKIEPEAKN